MTKVRIFKKDGTATPYFWSTEDAGDRTSVTVYKRTTDGVKRKTGVSFNTITNQMRRE